MVSRTMSIDRRGFLLGSVLALATTRQSALGGTEPAPDAVEFVSACRHATGGYAVALLTRSGRIVREIALDGRGHDIAIDRAGRRAVAFARRPGYFAVAFDLDGRTEPHVFAPEPGRHFFGHGAFADGGRLLLATEHDIDTGDGLVGVYDVAQGCKRIGEFPSRGVGPHEAIVLADGRTLAVANGGIATDPSSGRESIDVSGMVPSLAFIDIETGDLRAEHRLQAEINMLSIRHIAASAKGEVWFGAQWQGGLESAPELIGRASLDKGIALIAPSDPMGTALKGYIGSVAMSRDGRCLVASAPRAGRIVYIDTETAAVAAETALPDGCGVAALGAGLFALSSGLGALRIEKPGEAPLESITVGATEFDNHLRLIG